MSFLPLQPIFTGTIAQNSFDAALMKGRSMVEQAVGLLTGRWRILQDLNVGINHAPQTIVACCVLHNICQIAGELEPTVCKDQRVSGPPTRVSENEKSSYFFGESVSLQYANVTMVFVDASKKQLDAVKAILAWPGAAASLDVNKHKANSSFC